MQHKYRCAKLNGKLSLDDLNIIYSHLGGLMCQINDFTYPDLSCKICGKQLQHLCQYVSELSTDQQYRIINVLICNNNDHYTESIKVLVTNKTISSASIQNLNNENQVATLDPNSMDLVALTALMGQATKAKDTSTQNQENININYTKRQQDNYFQPLDICTSNCEHKIYDFLLGNVDIATEEIVKNPCFSDTLLQIFNNSMFIIGTDRSPLSQQQCILKMKKNEFDDESYSINKVQNQDESDENSNDDVENNPEEDLKEDYVSKQEIQQFQELQEKEQQNIDDQTINIQQKCQCDGCKQFYKDYMHEFDIFSSVIWQLKMHKVENNADFKILYIFTPRIFNDGIYEGICIVMKDNDDQLNKLLLNLQKKK